LKYEYLLFNIIVLSGPVFFGSFKKYYFWNYSKEAFRSIFITAIPFLIWDSIVSNRHWFFAEEYTIGFRILNLPIEEILFFITVPYACLFSWEMVKRHKIPSLILSKKISGFIFIVIFTGSIISLINGKEYTTLAGLAFLSALLTDKIWGAFIFDNSKFLFFFVLISLFTLIFNGYLTWRPIVTYDATYQLDFRIFTIPIEDFFFGYALLILCTSIYEKLLNRNIHTD